MTPFQGRDQLVERGETLRKQLIALSLQGTYPEKLLTLAQDPQAWAEALPAAETQKALDRDWQAWEGRGYWALSLDDDLYPALLRQLPDPPLLLFGRGDPTCLSAFCLAQIGTRKASSYGQKYAWQFAYDLAAQGAVIVSGLASGIDSIGHRAALEAGGKTIAVLGTAIDNIYPAHHQDLAQAITTQGCIISEFAPGFHTQAYHFLQRNRIISGLAQGVVIIEAGARSGTLNTAHHAAAQGKDLFCLPGNVDLPRSAGTNWLIQQGAGLVCSAEDIMAAYPLQWPDPKDRTQTKDPEETLPPLTKQEKALYAKLLQAPLSIEELLAQTQLQPGDLWLLLTQLEALDLVQLNSMNCYEALLPSSSGS